MKKFIKYSLISLLSLVVLLVVAVVLVITLVNPNRFKPFIEKAVYQATGRTLTMAGDISWSIYPNLGLKVRKLSLANPIGFESTNLMELNSADVSVMLLPLLEHEVKVKTLAIDGLNLGLVQKNGRNNWTFNPAPENTPIESAVASKTPGFKVELTGFSLTNSNLSLDNFDQNKHYKLTNTKLILTTDFDGKIKFDQDLGILELNKVNLNYNDLALANLNIQVESLNQELPNSKGDFEISKLKANELIKSLNLMPKYKPIALIDNLGLKTSFQLADNQLNLKDFNFNLNEQIKGIVNLQLKDLKNPSFNGKFVLEPFNLNQVLNGLNIAVKERKDKRLLDKFSVKASSFNGGLNSIQLNDLALNVGNKVDLNFSKLNVNNFKAPNITGGVTIPSFNLNQVLDELNIARESRKNKPLLNDFNLSTSFNVSTTTANLNALKLNFGNNLQINVPNLIVNNFNNPSFSGSFNLPTFSLNKLMPLVGESAPNLNNKAWLDKVNIASSFLGTKNSLNLSNLNLNLSNTNLKGQVNISSFKPMAINQSVVINNIDLADISNINGYRVPLSGLQLIGNSNFASQSPMTTISGSQVVKIANISLRGLSLNELVLEVDRTLNKASAGNDNWMRAINNAASVLNLVNQMKALVSNATKSSARNLNKTTNLGSFNLNLKINKGVINPSSFKLDGPNAVVNGNGNLNLDTKKINYNAKAKLTINGINPIFKELEFPIIIGGTTTNPSGRLDWSSIQSQLLRYAVKQNKTQIQNAVKQGVNQAVGEQVKKAIGNNGANKVVDEVSKGISNAIGNLFGK